MVRRIRFAARLDAALAVASSVLVLGFARAAATDMLLAAPFGLSLLAWYCWYRSREDGGDEARGSHAWLVLFYALNALGMLAKGPVAPALAAFVLIAFCTLQRDVRQGKLRVLWRTLDPIGIAVFFAIAAPWYVLVQVRNPEFFRVFFLEHNLARFGSNLYRHKQPLWYYIPVALAATMPWTVWVIQGLGDGWRGLRSQFGGAGEAGSTAQPNKKMVDRDTQCVSAPDAGEADCSFEIFLSLWALVPIAFFSLSHSKLPGYILPAIPALVILGAVAVNRRAAADERPGRVAIGAHAALLGVLAAALCLAPRLALKVPVSAAGLTIAASAGTAVLLIVALPMLITGWASWRFVTLLPLILGVGVILRGFAPALDATQSSRPVAEVLRQVEEQTDPASTLPVATFSLNRNTAFGMGFYLNRLVAPYEGLEISPAVYELPPAIPASAHILVTREGSRPALGMMLARRQVRWLGAYRPQRLEIYAVSAAP
jgi:4-amino-4-deoxy-L-arabinose transferase-like glycosyltransferase